MNLFFLILIFVFVVAPILDRLKRAGMQPPPATRPDRYGQPPPRYGAGRPPLQGDPAARTTDQPASDLLTEDLWALLTGQQSQRRLPGDAAPRSERTLQDAPRELTPWDAPASPSPASEPRAQWSAEEDEVAEAEHVLLERAESMALARRLPAPPVRDVSLETEPPPPEVRHAEFHHMLERTAAQRVTAASPRGRALGLADHAEVQRALILSEILGTPKGLE